MWKIVFLIRLKYQPTAVDLHRDRSLFHSKELHEPKTIDVNVIAAML